MMMRRGKGPAGAVLLLLLCLLQLLRASEEITRAKLTVTEIQYQNGSTWNPESLPQLSLSTVQFSPPTPSTLGFSPSQGSCSACVHVRVRMKASDFTGTLTIKYRELSTTTRRAISIKNGVNNDTLQWSDLYRPIVVGKTNINRLHLHDIGHTILWELVYDCFPADAGREVYVSLSSKPPRQHRFPYLLPCVCVQVYYTHLDARRTTVCPFVNGSLDGGRDVWRSSNVTLYGELGSSMAWSALCPAAYLKPSASLCWRHQRNTPHCNPILNSTLEDIEQKGDLVSADDDDEDDEDDDDGGGTRETQLNLPLSSLTQGLCVQVWRSDPAQYGRRLLCPDYSNRRWGLYAVAALTLLVTVATLGSLIHYVTKKGVTGWLFIQRPVLLVCSSEQSAHVSAVCALASFLQGELCAEVRMALWAQSSIGAGPGAVERSWAGVAELGPVPWLYGQWEAVREAGGQMLIVWSAEAKESYRSWREEREGGDRREGEKTGGSKGEEMQRGERGGEEMEGLEKTRGEQEQAGMKKGGEWKEESRSGEEREPSSVTGPVFRAALSCLQGALEGEGRVHGFTIVYFQGLCHSRDIPKDLRGVPRYCLPQDFGGLIRELGRTARGRNSVIGSWDCSSPIHCHFGWHDD
ncbi:unnamed protein product [Coregonus sp. 'balchen']|nr:unnamed protein product [Coregonus sp. 'balchen']